MTLDEVAAVALALPETAEVTAWGDERTFRTRNKIFVMGSPGSATVTVRTSVQEQTELIAAEPATFAVAPYVGRFGWTQVRLSTVDADELRELIVEAWRRTAARRAVRRYDEDAGQPSASTR